MITAKVDEWIDGFRKSIGERARETRLGMDITQDAFGDRVGSSQATIARIEAGSPRVSIDRSLSVLLHLAPGGLAGCIGGDKPSFIALVKPRKALPRSKRVLNRPPRYKDPR